VFEHPRNFREKLDTQKQICFYAFYKLGNAPKSVLPRTPLGKLTALPQTPSWWGGGSPRPPQEPHPSSALRASAIQAVLCRPPTPPKINPIVTALSPANLAKTVSVDFEIIGLTEIETEAGLAEQVDPVSRRFHRSDTIRYDTRCCTYMYGEVTSQSLWSRHDRHFVGITWHNMWSQGAKIYRVIYTYNDRTVTHSYIIY